MNNLIPDIMKKEWVMLVILILLFIGLLLFHRIFTGFDLAFQLTAACLGALLTMFITRMLLRNQSESEEEKEKNVKIYENKINVYSNFISTMWETLEDEDITNDELRKLRSEVFNKLIFYIKPYRIEAIEECINKMHEAKINAENLGTVYKINKSQFAVITKILREDLRDTTPEESTKEENEDKILRLWESFKIAPPEETELTVPTATATNPTVTPKVELNEPASDHINPTTYSGQFWHFCMLGYDQLRAFMEGKYELSLVEYEEDWRTNLVKQVKVNDIVFLFRRGGWGYIGAYKVLGYRIMNFETNKEEIVLNGKTETRQPIPGQDIHDYDFYKSQKDSASLCSNIIVEQLAYYDKGVSYPGGAYRRTISRYFDEYGRVVLSRLLAYSEKDKENFGVLYDEDNKTPIPMRTNIDAFTEIIRKLDIKPAEIDSYT